MASVLACSALNAVTSFVAFDSLSITVNDSISTPCDSIKCDGDSVKAVTATVAVCDSANKDSVVCDSVNRDSVVCDSMKTSTDSVQAEKEEKKVHGLSVFFWVKDFLLHEALDSGTVHVLLAKDSTEVSQAWFGTSKGDNRAASYVSAYFTKPGQYLIRVRSDNYRTEYVPFNLKKIHKRENHRELNTLYMHRLPRERQIDLDEVVVKASKLKFYMDGDTLVYDADAFNMAEGSMLDGLIKRLPGVTLNRNGEIAVNGERVDELLLNGKNFFNSDRNLMLENLPSFMVKDVQVYERTPENVKGTSREQDTKKELVMNIKMKKEYNGGWIANAEGGLGTPYEKNINGKHDVKYLGRFLALRFDDKSRFSMFANLNNLNDYRDPGTEDGEWTPLQQSEGLTTSCKVGMNGLYSFGDNTRYEGSVNYQYSDTYDEVTNNSTHSFSDENTGKELMRYSSGAYRNQSYRHEIKTSHSFYTRKNGVLLGLFKNANISLNPQLLYTKGRNNSNDVSASLSENIISRLGKSWLDSISAPDACDMLRKFAVDRSRNKARSNGHTTYFSGYGYGSASPVFNDHISFDLNYNIYYYDYSIDSYSHSMYDYPQSGQSSVFQNRYDPQFSKRLDEMVSLSSSISLGKGHSVSFNNRFNYVLNENNNYVYMLQKLDDWNDENKHELGTLPSMEDKLKALDSYNSTTKTEYNTTYSPSLTYQIFKYNNKTGSSTNFSVSFGVPLEHKGIDFWQGDQADVSLTSNNVFFNPSISYRRSNYKKGFNFDVSANMSSSSPSLYYMIDVENTDNPQYRSKNNANLKNEREISFSTRFSNRFNRTMVNANAQLNITQNSVGNSRLVNATNGFVLDSVININGNWHASFAGGVDAPLSSGEKWRLRNDLKYNFRNSVDCSGIYGAEAAESTVKNHNVSEELNLVFRPSHILELTAKGKLDWQHSSSARTDFTTINTFTYNYGLIAQLELPLNMQFATDITMYSRRGYSNMNSDELVWNARLSKRLMKGNLVIQLDGFDILGNLSNVRVYQNGRGFTEYMYNVIPSYCLVHAIWRMNKQPKKNTAK